MIRIDQDARLRQGTRDLTAIRSGMTGLDGKIKACIGLEIDLHVVEGGESQVG